MSTTHRATSASARTLLFRLESGSLATALVDLLRDEVVLAGHVRAGGVVEDVELRTVDARGHAATPRRLAGAFQLVSLEGSVGLDGGDVTCGMRVVLARESDTGLQTFAGELVDARIVAVEGTAVALDDVTSTRARTASGLTLLASLTPAPGSSPAPGSAPALVPTPAPAPATWAEAARASEEAARPPPPPAPPAAPRPPAASGVTFTPQAMPPRPVRPSTSFEDETVYPDAGDVVEHFAFGRCEVIKSDGDRLHLRLGKDGRVKEIALEMLRVTPLPPVEGTAGRHFKLDRRL